MISGLPGAVPGCSKARIRGVPGCPRDVIGGRQGLDLNPLLHSRGVTFLVQQPLPAASWAAASRDRTRIHPCVRLCPRRLSAIADRAGSAFRYVAHGQLGVQHLGIGKIAAPEMFGLGAFVGQWARLEKGACNRLSTDRRHLCFAQYPFCRRTRTCRFGRCDRTQCLHQLGRRDHQCKTTFATKSLDNRKFAAASLSTASYLVGPRTGRSLLSYDFSIVEQQSDASY